MIINAARPFLSSSDIDKGARWSTEIATRLEKAKAGIICLTPSNMQSEWILFEAGALSKTLADTYVCTLLVDMKPTDVKGPLSQFQATTTSEADMLQLVKTLNSKLGESAVQGAHLEKAFKLIWPELNAQIQNLPKETVAKSPTRSAEDMLEELLGLVRNLSRPSLPLLPPHLHKEERRDAIQRVVLEELSGEFSTIKWDDTQVDLVGEITVNGRKRRFVFPLDTPEEVIRHWLRIIFGEHGENKSEDIDTT